MPLGAHFNSRFLAVLKTGVISQASGSAYLEMENTKVMCSVHGPRPSMSGREFADKAVVSCEFKFTSWSGDNIRRGYQPADEEKEAAQFLVGALQVAICCDQYPKSSIDINVLILQDAGGALAGAVNCACLALLDAGVQMFCPVSACHLSVSSSLGGVVLDPSPEDSSSSDASVTVALMGEAKVTQLVQSGSLSPDQLLSCVDLGVSACQKMQQLLGQHCIAAMETAAISTQ